MLLMRWALLAALTSLTSVRSPHSDSVTIFGLIDRASSLAEPGPLVPPQSAPSTDHARSDLGL